ncbi:MFS transporter [Dactylosporangium sp. NPDC049140]|uniref:MFS transporter n=1 Tax=Dactylosporangium sp. NPDC049140 TaxID=3155647 RepID=UPI0034106FB4
MNLTRRPGWAPVLLSYATFMLVGLNAGVGGVLIVSQMADYRVDEATIGITFFTSSAGYMLAGATAGALLHRVHVRMALLIGVGVYALGAVAMAVRPAFAILVAVQLLVGYGTGILESILNVFLAELPNSTTLLNRLHAFFGVGAFLGPLLAAWLLQYLEWTSVFLVLGVLCVPLATGFLLAYPRKAPAVEHADAPRPTGMLRDALRSPAVVLGSTFLAVYVGLEIGVGTWAFTFLVQEHGEPSVVAGYTVSGYWLGLTLGRFLISPLATRIGMSAAAMATACLVGVTAGAAVLWAVPTAALATAAFVLLGFFLGPLFPTAMAVTPQLVPPRLMATAIGVMNGTSLLGGAGLPWLAGWLAQHIGIWTLMPFALVLSVVQLGVWRLMVTRGGAGPDRVATPEPAAPGL